MYSNAIFSYIKHMINNKASDLHLQTNKRPYCRINGHLISLGSVVTEDNINSFLVEILSKEEYHTLLKIGEVDFSFNILSEARFRGNAYKHNGKLGIALRYIPTVIPKLHELNLPQKLVDLTKLNSGLVIVTGPTGCGKSTTLASLIDIINATSSKHILTLEDPIEYFHKSHQSIVTQREVNKDTLSFASGLKSALREDPDVILIGEMRDLETTEIAIRAAETGHLVFATMHTPGATQSIERIIGIFPPHQRAMISNQLSFCLKAVVYQKLLPKKNGGRIAALEVLRGTKAVSNLIRENKTHQLQSIMQTSQQNGMITMSNYIKELYHKQFINQETYREAINQKGELNGYL